LNFPTYHSNFDSLFSQVKIAMWITLYSVQFLSWKTLHL